MLPSITDFHAFNFLKGQKTKLGDFKIDHKNLAKQIKKSLKPQNTSATAGRLSN